jgi:predicted nucleic acid-binding protein
MFCPPVEAWRVYDEWRSDDRVIFLPERADFGGRWRRFGNQISGGPNVWRQSSVRVKAWFESLPYWLEIRPLASTPNPELNHLGRGEREAIQLAEEQRASLPLNDERKGQAEAARRGLSTTGTLGVLLDAGEAGLIDPPQAYRRLIEETTFRISPALEGHFLRRFV